MRTHGRAAISRQLRKYSVFVKDIRNSYPNARQKENVPEEAYKWQKNTAIGICKKLLPLKKL